MINVIRNSNTGISTIAAGLLTSVIISITFLKETPVFRKFTLQWSSSEAK